VSRAESGAESEFAVGRKPSSTRPAMWLKLVQPSSLRRSAVFGAWSIPLHYIGRRRAHRLFGLQFCCILSKNGTCRTDFHSQEANAAAGFVWAFCTGRTISCPYLGGHSPSTPPQSSHGLAV